MANMATGQPPLGVVQVSTTTPNPSLSPQPQNHSYKSILNPNSVTTENISIPAPSFDLHHGEPSFVWDDKVVDVMMKHEELHYAVIGKFSYGMPEFHALRKVIPLQCEIKGECSVGFLETRHVVIRLSLLEDYVHLLSRPAFSLKLGADFFSMRTMKYDVWFDPREETSIAIAWISFPGLPPPFFIKDAVFALASAVGKPLQLDAATKAKTRPSCAKVKVEVDLLAPRPQRLRIGIKNTSSGEIRFKWIRIRYDFMPKYCKECRLQGHNEDECFALHPDLVPQEEVQVKRGRTTLKEPVKEAPLKVLQSGKIVGNMHEAGEVVPVQSHDRQNKIFKKFIHPNRNPNAWSRVEKNNKQVHSDAACTNQGNTLVTTNAFAMLDKVDELHHEVDKSEKIQDKDENFIQRAVVDDAKDSSVPEVAKASTHAKDSSVPVAMDLGNVPEGGKLLSPKHIGTRSWVREVFSTHPKVDAVGVSVKSGTGMRKADLNFVEAEKARSFETVPGNNFEDSRLRGLSVMESLHGDFLVMQPSHVGAAINNSTAINEVIGTPSLIENIPPQSACGINESSDALYAVEPRGDCLNSQASFNVIVSQALLNAEGESRGEWINEQPLDLLCKLQVSSAINVKSPSRAGQFLSNDEGNLMQPCVDSKSPSLIKNILSAVEPRGELKIDEQLGSSCASFTDSRGIDINDVQPPSTFIANNFDAALDKIPLGALNVVGSRGEVQPSALHDSQSPNSPIVDVGAHLNELFCEDLETAAVSTSPLGTKDAEGITLSQQTCVENKQALTIPSLEVSTTLESVSVSKPKFYGKDLIPTIQLERLCRSASPNFGKTFLNINAPSFVPKSLMQLVPHSKNLPTDDELVKRMDLNDTRGILARQVASFQERIPKGHYLVEDDDLFEEEELDEESTAHNFSMVAREGDLSPREIHDNAPKRVRRFRRPLEPTRVQPTRSTKSKSQRSKKSKK